MESTRSFTMEGADLLHVAGVARNDISARIVGTLHEFVSIVTRRATSELVVHFSFSTRC